jgi:CheY-like chemotaxis protein
MPRLSPLKILLIEDDAEVRDTVASMLASLGHSVVEAAGGREGLARLEAGEAVDLVLTDLRMPGMSGWQVAQAVKARWHHIPVGILTGTPELLAEQGAPVDFVLAKPVGLDTLRAAIRRVSARGGG